MRILRTLGIVLILAALAVPLAAQTPVKDLLRRAKAAREAENRDLAEKLYLQIIELDPEQSDPYYRLGVLARNAEVALGWFKQYVELEPGDAWGWLAVGEKSLKVGKTREALAAFERAAKLAPNAEDIREGLTKGRLRAAPTLEPIGGYSVDSESFHVVRYGAEGWAALPGGFRLGGRFVRSELDGNLLQASIDEFLVRVEGRPRQALRLDLTAGLASTTAQGTGIAGIFTIDPATTPVADLRLRWRDPDGGPAFDVRLQRMLFASTPALVVSRAVQDDARIGLELPVGPLRIRGMGRASLIETDFEASNTRLQADAALVLPLGWRGEVSLQFHALGFAQASDAGYFAPKSVETREIGTYWELGGEGRVSAELDLGIGLQRLAKQGEAVGPWKPAFRGWGWLGLDIVPAVQVRLEAEAYSAPFAPVQAVATENWQYFSVSIGLLMRLR
jgi:tetratricopeptide (TPR) repeat protein